VLRRQSVYIRTDAVSVLREGALPLLIQVLDELHFDDNVEDAG
jgi:hypothetical protein